MPAGKEIPSPPQTPPPPWSAPDSGNAPPSHPRVEAVNTRVDPDPNLCRTMGTIGAPGTNGCAEGSSGHGAAPDSEGAARRPERTRALRAATQSTRRGLPPTAQPGGPGPVSAPPGTGQGLEQHSPGGSRHDRPAPESREGPHPLRLVRSRCGGGAWAGLRGAGCP